MSISAIIALIRDAVIVGLLGYITVHIYTAGENSVEKKDLEKVNQQLMQNAKDVAAWAEQSKNAEAQRRIDIANTNAHIDAQRAPIIVRVPSNSTTAVPGVPAAAGSCPATGGGSDKGYGVDVRPAINAFEQKYEGYLATCRFILASWPR